jgi:hypothetical protein
MGLMNMCGNLTYYALSANLIGYFLDMGMCKLSNDDLPTVDVLPIFTNPDTNTSMMIDVPVDCRIAFATCLADEEQVRCP